jgi:hypothetical protein
VVGHGAGTSKIVWVARLLASPCDLDQRPTVTEIGWACRSIKVRLPSGLASLT